MVEGLEAALPLTLPLTLPLMLPAISAAPPLPDVPLASSKSFLSRAFARNTMRVTDHQQRVVEVSEIYWLSGNAW